MPDTTQNTSGRKTAGAFDVRTTIGGLLGIYGVILLLMGLFADAETDKTGGTNANLWAGLGLLLVSGVFFAWWRLRPIVVPATDDEGETPPSTGS
jgi:LPXTG-motif cell wall-anchored protein